jgi:DNA-binding NarL/FixJ family response regulator
LAGLDGPATVLAVTDPVEDCDLECGRTVLASSQTPAKLESLKDLGNPVARTRILLADDNTAILDHVSEVLGADYDIIAKVADGNFVCAEVGKLKPDLIVLDISMGERSGIEICRQLREQGYAGEIVFLTVHEDNDFVSAAIGAGGRGYVIKSRMSIDLALALKTVLDDRIFISPPLR